MKSGIPLSFKTTRAQFWLTVRQLTPLISWSDASVRLNKTSAFQVFVKCRGKLNGRATFPLLKIACRPFQNKRDAEIILNVWFGTELHYSSWLFPKTYSNVPNAFQCTFVTDVFGTVDPFGSNSFASKGGGFADFSQMSKVSSWDS